MWRFSASDKSMRWLCVRLSQRFTSNSILQSRHQNSEWIWACASFAFGYCAFGVEWSVRRFQNLCASDLKLLLWNYVKLDRVLQGWQQLPRPYYRRTILIEIVNQLRLSINAGREFCKNFKFLVELQHLLLNSNGRWILLGIFLSGLGAFHQPKPTKEWSPESNSVCLVNYHENKILQICKISRSNFITNFSGYCQLQSGLLTCSLLESVGRGSRSRSLASATLDTLNITFITM